MDAAHPLAVVTPSLDGDVLTRLALADTAFTPGQLQRLIPHATVAGIRRVLKRLAEQGVVTMSSAGVTAKVFELNREHLAADAIVELASQVPRLLERIGERVGSWIEPPTYAAVFGSFARRQATTVSDVDIFLVRPARSDDEVWFPQVEGLESAVTRWTGNDARAFVIDEDRLAEPGYARVLDDIVREGISVTGDPVWLRKAIARMLPPSARPLRRCGPRE